MNLVYGGVRNSRIALGTLKVHKASASADRPSKEFAMRHPRSDDAFSRATLGQHTGVALRRYSNFKDRDGGPAQTT